MAIDPAQLLRRLEPAVRPSGASPVRRAPGVPIEQRDFDSLLTLVASGDVHSGRPVRCDCELDPPLDDSQWQRLASAADQAEAEGSQRAVMILDGRALVMDVPERVIDTEVSAQPRANSFTRVDAAVFVPGDGDATDRSLPPFPGTGLIPGAVADQLERALLLEDSAAATVPQQTNDTNIS